MSAVSFWQTVLLVNILLFRLRDVSDRELSVRSNAGAARSCVDDQIRDWYNVRPANCDLVDPKRRSILWSNTTGSLKLQHTQQLHRWGIRLFRVPKRSSFTSSNVLTSPSLQCFVLKFEEILRTQKQAALFSSEYKMTKNKKYKSSIHLNSEKN